MLTTLDRLSFGRKIPNGDEVTHLDWEMFEVQEVATRFPNGYTVLSAEGAWKDATTGHVIHEPTTILEVAHDGSEEMLKAVEAVARVYKVLFHQDAVMRTTTPLRVDFI